MIIIFCKITGTLSIPAEAAAERQNSFLSKEFIFLRLTNE